MARDIDSKMDTLVIKNNPPIASEGAEGDLTVRNVRGGLKLYVKHKNAWEGVSLSQRPIQIDRAGNITILGENLTISGSSIKGSGGTVITMDRSNNVTLANNLTVTGGTTISGGNLTVNGLENGTATLFLNADESDDSGDDWRVQATTSYPSRIAFANNASGSFQPMFYIDPHSTPTSSNAVFAGQVTIQNYLFLKMEIATPTSPEDGSGALLYPKTDGDPYWISHDQGEVNLNLIKTATITVSEAEFDALDTTAKTIVAAPGANKVIILTDAIVFATHGSTQTGRENLTIGWNGGTTYETDVAAWISRFMSGESGNRTFRFAMVDANGDAFWQSINMGDNQPLTLGLTGSLPDGCISSLKVLVNYYIFDNS